MSAQLQVQLDDNAQWSAMAGTTGTGATAGTVTVAAPIGWRKLYAIRVQYPAAALGPGLTGFIEVQYLQNSVERLPSNTDPIRVPVTDDTEVFVYAPPNAALNLQFFVLDLRYQGALLDNKAVRVSVLHTLERC